MAHTRHRKFNTRDTYPEQKLDNDLAQAVVARGTIDLPARPVSAGPGRLRRTSAAMTRWSRPTR
jgi:hypothetical protein